MLEQDGKREVGSANSFLPIHAFSIPGYPVQVRESLVCWDYDGISSSVRFRSRTSALGPTLF